MLDYVACLTTIPSRMDHLHLTLDSLLNQQKPFDRVYLCVPLLSVRFKCAYEIPERIATKKGVSIVRCTDMGPATKILGLLEANLPEIGPTTRIFFCDDDRVYESDRSKRFYEASREHPDAVVCLATTSYWKFFLDKNPGYDYNSDGDFPSGKYGVRSGYVDVFEGFGGVVVQPRFFGRDVVQIPSEYSVVDDIWLSGHIKKQGIKIWGVHALTPPMHDGAQNNPLYQLQGDQERSLCNRRCIEYYQTKHGIWDNVEATSLDQRIPIPSIDSVHRLMNTITALQGPLKLKSTEIPAIERPDEYILELSRFRDTDVELKRLLPPLLKDCEHVSTLIQQYTVAKSYLTENKLLSVDAQDRLWGPIHAFVTESSLRDRIDAFLVEYKRYRSDSLKAALFQSRLLCHSCRTRVYHFAIIPCGHLVCETCRRATCPVCSKPASACQPIALH